ncbi:hypothetical protein Efla_002455 [Eimeria flavescens]
MLLLGAIAASPQARRPKMAYKATPVKSVLELDAALGDTMNAWCGKAEAVQLISFATTVSKQGLDTGLLRRPDVFVSVCIGAPDPCMKSRNGNFVQCFNECVGSSARAENDRRVQSSCCERSQLISGSNAFASLW